LVLLDAEPRLLQGCYAGVVIELFSERLANIIVSIEHELEFANDNFEPQGCTVIENYFDAFVGLSQCLGSLAKVIYLSEGRSRSAAVPNSKD
jgi:hypothetical protein